VKKIGAFVGRFKQFSQYHIAGRGPTIWEEGYHDLICVSERMNRAVDAYIANNPLKWWLMHGDKSLMHVVEPFLIPSAGGDDFWRAVYVTTPQGGRNRVVYRDHPTRPPSAT